MTYTETKNDHMTYTVLIYHQQFYYTITYYMVKKNLQDNSILILSVHNILNRTHCMQNASRTIDFFLLK